MSAEADDRAEREAYERGKCDGALYIIDTLDCWAHRSGLIDRIRLQEIRERIQRGEWPPKGDGE